MRREGIGGGLGIDWVRRDWSDDRLLGCLDWRTVQDSRSFGKFVGGWREVGWSDERRVSSSWRMEFSSVWRRLI